MLKPGGPKQYYCHSRYAAKKRGIGFSLTESEFAFIVMSNCFYCGEPPNTPVRRWTGSSQRKNNDELLHGIDRVDNSKAYQAGNVVPCCSICNSIKNDLSIGGLLCHLPKMLQGLTNFVVRWKKLQRPKPIVKGTDISSASIERNMNWYFAERSITRGKMSPDSAHRMSRKSISTRQVNPLKKRSCTKFGTPK